MSKPKKFLKNSLGNSRLFIQYTNVAFRMIIIILVGVFGGIKLDEYLGLGNSIFTIILTLLGVTTSMYIIIKEMTKK
jgi:F0F1-type ATP synthase assembly protein I